MDYPAGPVPLRGRRVWKTRPVSAPDYEQRVRDIWEAYARDGVAGLRGLVDDDVEWTLSSGHTVRGLDALAEHLASGGQHQAALPHSWEQHGECVLVHGSLRTFRDGGFVDTQPSWVYFFRGGRLLRAVSYGSRAAALAAIERHAASS